MSYHTLLRTLVEAQAQLGRAQATVWEAEEALSACLPQVEVRTVHADANLCTPSWLGRTPPWRYP